MGKLNFKQIKNYLVIAIIVFGGLITLWNQINPETEVEPSAIANETEESNEIEGGESESSLASESDLSDIREGSELEVSIEGSSSQEDVVEPAEGQNSESERLVSEAEDSIEDFPDVLGVIWVDELDGYIIDSFSQYNDDGWFGLIDGQSQGTKAGGRFGDYDDQLPNYDSNGYEISYTEFDVNDKISGQSRDAQRFVVGSDGSVYLTLDHYDTFVRIVY